MLNEDMKLVVAQSMLCFVATVNEDGTPNLSPKSSLRVFDNNHLLFANMASPNTLRNLGRNPATEINCVDVFSRRGYRFKGTATIHSGRDPIFLSLKSDVAAEHGDSIPVYDGCLVKILSATSILSPAYTFIEGVTEEKLRAAYFEKYQLWK